MESYLNRARSTSVTLNSIGKVRSSGKSGGVCKGIGGKGVLGAAGESGDDVFLTSPEEGTGQPGGGIAGVALELGDCHGEVAD